MTSILGTFKGQIMNMCRYIKYLRDAITFYLPEEGPSNYSPDDHYLTGWSVRPDLQRLLDSAAEFDSSSSGSESEGGEVEGEGEGGARNGFYQMEFRQHKRDYYINKLGYSQVHSSLPFKKG